MDKREEEVPGESSQQIITTPLLTTFTTTSTSLPATPTNLLSTTDDDTSIESSDTFETWTLVNNKENNKTLNNLDEKENRVQILTNIDHKELHGKEEQCKNVEGKQSQDSPSDTSSEDYSDGISIISESESMGRVSPHPCLEDHLHNLQLKFALGDHVDDFIVKKLKDVRENESTPFVKQQDSTVAMATVATEVTAASEQELRHRRRSSSSATACTVENNQALQKLSQTLPLPISLPSLLKQGIIYLSVCLVLLALIGKIMNPTWQPNTTNSALLEQKLNDMELQNNLIRAEVDLLNKQVKYLSSLKEPQQKSSKGREYKDGKTFKAWPGVGDSMKPIDITKGDLKKPFKCSDGSFVEIANMCLEQDSENDPSLVEQFGQVVNEMKRQSKTFRIFDNVAEEIQEFRDYPFDQIQDFFDEKDQEESQKTKFNKNKPIYQPTKDEPYLSASYKPHEHHEDQGRRKDTSTANKDYKKPHGKDYNVNANFPEFKKHRNQYKNDRMDDKFRYNSKEMKYDKFKSKERFNKNYDTSKEKIKFDKNGPKDYNNGEWQINYMKNRENQRKKHEQKYTENWANWDLERAKSRERKRNG